MRPDLAPLLIAGFLTALLELAWVLARGRALFLSDGERLSYALVALTALPGLVLLVGLAVRPALSGEPRAIWPTGVSGRALRVA
jgi:hypothetical protein